MPTFATFNILDACREPGCPVCRLEQEAVVRYLDGQFYESVNNPDFRDRLRASLGFCREHAWLAVDQHLGDALGFAIIYHDVVGAALERLEKNVPPPSTRQWAALLRRVPEQVGALVQKAVFAFTPKKRCPACQQLDEATHNLIAALVEGLGSAEMAEALRGSDGLCLPHLRQALQEVKDLPECELLISIHKEKLENLHAELAELIHKHDYRFLKKGFGKEGNSWRHTIAMMVGTSDSKD